MDLQCVQTRCFNIFSQHTFTYLIDRVPKVTVAEVRLLTWSKDSDLAHYQHVLLPRRLARRRCERKHI